jgi:hypothetical protein
MSDPLTIEENHLVSGEIALTIAPGTSAQAQQRALDEALMPLLEVVSAKLRVVLAAAPYHFARPLPGKDAEGKTHFAVRGRAEGDRLLPDHRADRRRRR